MGFKIGQRVYWVDPDEGLSSGFYDVIAKAGNMLQISNGITTAEVFESECWEVL